MVAALRLIALLQAGPELHVSVDQDRIAVGDEVSGTTTLFEIASLRG